MRPVLVTYFTWLGEVLITVPRFPAWVCDMCGCREYDPHALSRLAILLDPHTGKSTLRPLPAPQTRRPGPRPSRPIQGSN